MRIKYSLNHVVELSFYFEDPEGHVIEIYWGTGLPPVSDVHAEPIDLKFLRNGCAEKLSS